MHLAASWSFSQYLLRICQCRTTSKQQLPPRKQWRLPGSPDRTCSENWPSNIHPEAKLNYHINTIGEITLFSPFTNNWLWQPILKVALITPIFPSFLTIGGRMHQDMWGEGYMWAIFVSNSTSIAVIHTINSDLIVLQLLIMMGETWVHVGSEPTKTKTSRPNTKISRFRPSRLGYSSHSAVIIASSPPNVLSNPSVISIKKKIMDQRLGITIFAIASGYTIKMRPGPRLKNYSFLNVSKF